MVVPALDPAWILWASGPTGADAHVAERGHTTEGLYDSDAQAMFGFVRRLGLNDEQADDAV